MRPGEHRILVHVQEVLKLVPAGELSSLPSSFGAYVIEVESGDRYVGSSNTVRSRVRAHDAELDPNVREPIRRVCCYLSLSHMDARILEYWLIREIAPELNDSPASGLCGGRCSSRCQAISAPGRVLELDVGVSAVAEDLPPRALGGLANGPGAYVLKTARGDRYVGSSAQVQSRIRSHLENKRDPNVRERVTSMSVYGTRTHADAPILEYALIRDLDPELNRENQPDASEWKVGSRAALVAGAPEHLEALQAELGRRIKAEVGGTEVFRKGWVTYQVSPMKNFCAVKVLADCLQVDLKVEAAKLSDPGHCSEPLAKTQAWTFNRRLRVRTEADLAGALALIAQARDFVGRTGTSRPGGSP